MEEKIQKEAFKGSQVTVEKYQEWLKKDLENIGSLAYMLLSEPEIQTAIATKLHEVYQKRYANLLAKEEQKDGMEK